MTKKSKFLASMFAVMVAIGVNAPVAHEEHFSYVDVGEAKAAYPMDNLLIEPKIELPEIKKEPPYTEVRCKITAYSVGDGLTPSDVMANGQHVFEGAVAYNNVPLGTKIEIDGQMYTVCDRVAYDDVIDIYMNSIDKANDWGVQYKTVKIYNKES